MNQPRIALLGMVAGLLSVAAFSPVVRAQAAAPAPTHIAVVNLKQVYNTIQETVDTVNQLKGLQGEGETMQKSHQLDLQGLQQKIANSVKPDSSAHEDMMKDLDEKTIQFAIDEQKLKLRMVREQSRQLKQAFDEIQAAVAKLAAQRGYDLVLVNSNAELPSNAGDSTDPQTLANAVFNRGILYASDKADITPDVIAALNAAYKAKGSGN